jgi:acyl transferase domain-containing protein
MTRASGEGSPIAVVGMSCRLPRAVDLVAGDGGEVGHKPLAKACADGDRVYCGSGKALSATTAATTR